MNKYINQLSDDLATYDNKIYAESICCGRQLETAEILRDAIIGEKYHYDLLNNTITQYEIQQTKGYRFYN